MANLSRALRRVYGPLVAWENIKRRHGTRASGEWLLLSHDEDGTVVPWHIALSRTAGLVQTPLRIWFSSHAVARLAQRTVGGADMARIGPVLARHLTSVMQLLDDESAADFRTVTPGGAFLWKRGEHDRLVATTWLDAAGAAYPQVRADCALSDEARSALRVVAVGAAA